MKNIAVVYWSGTGNTDGSRPVAMMEQSLPVTVLFVMTHRMQRHSRPV